MQALAFGREDLGLLAHQKPEPGGSSQIGRLAVYVRDVTTGDVSSMLDFIEKALHRLARDLLAERLQDGVPTDVVRARLALVGGDSTPELESLYGWRNGTSTKGVSALDDIYLFPGYYLLSLEDAVANYQAFADDARWAAGWLPIFANGGGDFYVLDLGEAGRSPVRHFRIDESEHPVEFLSLGSMLATLAVAFDRGVFFIDHSGYLEMDDLAFGDVAAELNPDVPWWRT